MKMLNQLKVAALVGALTLASSGFGYGSSSSDAQFNQKLQKLDSLINPVVGSTDKGAEELTAQVEKEIAKLEEQITSPEEQAKRDQLAKLRKKIDRNKKEISAIPLIKDNHLKQKEQANENLQQAFAQLQSTPGAGLQQQDIDMSGLDSSCSKRVNTEVLSSTESALKNRAMSDLKNGQLQDLASNKDELREKSLANLKDAIKKDRENRKKKAKKDDFQPNLEEALASANIPEGFFSKEQRLQNLDADIAKLEKADEKWETKLEDEVLKLANFLNESDKQDSRSQQRAVLFANFIKEQSNQAKVAAITAANQLYKNCKANAEKLGKDNPLGPNTLLNSAYQMLVSYHRGDATYYANGFLQRLNGETRDMQCAKINTRIQAHFTTLESAIQTLETARSPETVLSGAQSVLTSLDNTMGAVGREFDAPKRACDRIAKFNKKVEAFIGSTQQAAQQQAQIDAQSGLPQDRRTGSVRTPVGQQPFVPGQPAHNGLPVR